MRVPRSTIADALVKLVQAVSFDGQRFNTVSKHYVHWESQDTTSWPVAYVRHSTEDVKRAMYGSSTYGVHYQIVCFLPVNAADPNFDQDDQVTNPLLDAIDAAFKAAIEGQKFDLGIRGVDEAYIEGKILIADGVDDGRAIYVIPVTVDVAG